MDLCSDPKTIENSVKRLVLILSCVVAGVSTIAQAQESTLEGNILNLPVVVVGNQFYSARLEIVPDTNPMAVVLVEAYEVTFVSTIGASIFNDNILTISQIWLEGFSYWVNFELVSDVGFVLQNYGINDTGFSSNNTLGLTDQPAWQRMLGEANDIGVGANGVVWVIGTDPRNGGYGIYRWNGQSWNRVEGGAVRIDVDPYGNPWVINDSHQIFRWVNGLWQRLPGDAIDVGIGANGSVWVVSGGGVYNWNGIDWDRYSGSAVRIDVDPTGNPWVIDYNDDIYQLVDGWWIEMPGDAHDIGIGGDGSVWVIGTRRSGGGYSIYRWIESDWNRVEGSARQISVTNDGRPWVAGSDGDIYSSQ